MTTETHDLAWFTDRLERSTTDPRPDFYECPVCGGGSLHIIEKLGGIVSAKCFGCDAQRTAITSALEGVEGPTITFGKKPKAPSRPAPGTPGSPLDWWADHCAVPRRFLDFLPLREVGDHLVFAFDGIPVVKQRIRGTKDFSWDPAGSATPPLWPVPARDLAPAMLITEGEGDATVMAYHVLRSSLDSMVSVHSITNPSVPVSAGVWRDLARRGLETVLVMFDDDGKKDSAADQVVANAREAGLDARRVHIAGIDLLLGEKDARDVWLRKVAADPESQVDIDLDEATIADMGARVLDRVAGGPPPDLIGDVGWDPEGLTILYGQGDSGKGVVTASDIAAMTRRGTRVLIADFEGHPSEWQRRIKGQGGDLTRVVIAEPNAFGWRGAQGAFWDVADDLRTVADDFGAEWVFVDSITTATVGAKDPYSSDTPVKFAIACQRMGRPVGALAHVTKTDDLTYPFGSIHWHTQARTTHSLVKLPGDKRTLEHRKQGNRPWRGKFDVAITFDDVAGVIDTTFARIDADAPGPTITVKGSDARVETFAALAVACAPTDASSAKSKTALATSLGSGNKGEQLRGVALAVERGDLALTDAGRVYRPTGSQVREPVQELREPETATPVPAPGPRTGSPGSDT
jgi:hypothetical protein